MAVIVKGGGGASKEEKTVTASTSQTIVTPTSGKLLSKVTVNPTPTQEKTVTAGTSQTSITPNSGYHLSRVKINPTPSEEKSVTPTTSEQVVTPASGKLLSKVTVGAAEDVTNEVNEQTSIIQNITESLVGKLSGANATASDILKGKKAYVGQNLVTGDYVPHGLYVWKKSKYTPPITVTNPSFIFNKDNSSSNGTKGFITNPTFDLSLIEDYKRFFNGFTNTTSSTDKFYTKDDDILYWRYSNDVDVVGLTVTSPIEGYLSVVTSANSSARTNAEFRYVGTKEIVYEKIGDFIEYVVSDKENEYPDKAEKDGYYYEKIIDKGGIEYGTITLVSTSAEINISHTLGAKPSYFALVPMLNVKYSQYASGSHFAANNINGSVLRADYIEVQNKGYDCSLSGYPYLRSTMNSSVGSVSFIDEANVKCTAQSNYPYLIGTYIWIALA